MLYEMTAHSASSSKSSLLVSLSPSLPSIWCSQTARGSSTREQGGARSVHGATQHVSDSPFRAMSNEGGAVQCR